MTTQQPLAKSFDMQDPKSEVIRFTAKDIYRRAKHKPVYVCVPGLSGAKSSYSYLRIARTSLMWDSNRNAEFDVVIGRDGTLWVMGMFNQ